MVYVGKEGKVSHLRVGVQEGAGWGPPADFIGTPVVVRLFGDEGYYGFELRPGPDLPASLAMLTTLRDAFMNDLEVGFLCKVEEGKRAGRIVRVDLARELVAVVPNLTARTGPGR